MLGLLKERTLIVVSLIIGVVITFSYIGFARTTQDFIINKDANSIIRFHCLANSDSKEDQELKIKVKNKVVSYMNLKLGNVKDINKSREIIIKNIDEIRRIAKEEIKRNGYDYNVDVKLEKNIEFPTKQYGNLIVPAGEYEALRVLIGKAKGKNWWCVMFPPLCFTDASCTVENTNDNVLQDEEDIEVEFDFKIKEILE